MKNVIIFVSLLFCITFAQDVKVKKSSLWAVSYDVASRYVWRGTDFGNSPSIQPTLSYTSGALTLGAWSAWQFSGQANKNDLYASYALGNYSFTLTDY